MKGVPAMALYKDVELQSGVTVSYHRVVSVSTVTNVQSTIEVASYTSRAKREEEAAAVGSGGGMDVFIETTWYVAPYDETVSIEGAYSYIKSLEEFSGAEDVWEEGQS